ncbi:MAG: ParB/RepB/Spo0J family partition protein [Syntrophobacterales bacterium]|jgi:ParB family chromosome partitioning protein|nr:ParB/RepB/Spo0J family partition protein [Syntrophobacterales bacterium]
MAAKKDPLGRGLSAILKDVEERGGIRLIRVDQIVPNPDQPRQSIKEEALLELAASIREKGLLQPLILKKNGGNKYDIIAGERRFRASVMAGLTEVSAIIKDVDDKEALEIALIENLQREDLNAVEIGATYQRFIDEFGYTHQDLAKKIGVDRSSVTNYVRILKLPEWIRKLMSEGKLSQGHGRALLALRNEKDQKRFVDKVLNEGASVRDLERAARKKNRQERSGFEDAADTLTEALGTKVDITFKKQKGKIIIEFYSGEDLDRIVESIVNIKE